MLRDPAGYRGCLGFTAILAASIVFVYDLPGIEFSLSAIATRRCGSITSSVLVWREMFLLTSIQKRLATVDKEILSTSNSKRTWPQSCPETSTANFPSQNGGGGEWRFLREVWCL